jgi:hypothetical protein
MKLKYLLRWLKSIPKKNTSYVKKEVIINHFDKYDIWICSSSRNPNMNKKNGHYGNTP